LDLEAVSPLGAKIYRSVAWIDVNVVFSLVPSPVMIGMIATASGGDQAVFDRRRGALVLQERNDCAHGISLRKNPINF
jgi:hypothetical protein